VIEIKKIFEEDSFDIYGYYSEGHVDKEEFLEEVRESIKEDIEEGSIYLMDEEAETSLISAVRINKVEYVWFKEEINDDNPLTTTFYFSSKAKKNYSEMTRYYI
jgi:hypothetical protein